jgi:hypothetical protein
VWRHALGDGAHCPFAAQRGDGWAAAAANPHAPVPTAQTPELDALSPIADYATADYAAILDRDNLKGAVVLKELVRKSVVPAQHNVRTEIFGKCINQVR